MLSYEQYISLIKEAVIYTHNMNKYKSSVMWELDFIGIDCQINVINKMKYDLILRNPAQLRNEDVYELFFNITQNQFGFYPSFYTVILKNKMENKFNFKDKHRNPKELKNKNFIDLEEEFKSYINNDNVKELIIRFEGNYEEGLYKNNLPIPDILYHISPTIYEKNILKNGLFPKAKQRSSYFPSRIHFLYDISNYGNLIKKFKINDGTKGKPKLKYSVYEINTKDIKKDIILHSDPNSDGCYTYDVIPPKNIKILHSNI